MKKLMVYMTGFIFISSSYCSEKNDGYLSKIGHFVDKNYLNPYDYIMNEEENNKLIKEYNTLLSRNSIAKFSDDDAHLMKRLNERSEKASSLLVQYLKTQDITKIRSILKLHDLILPNHIKELAKKRLQEEGTAIQTTLKLKSRNKKNSDSDKERDNNDEEDSE